MEVAFLHFSWDFTQARQWYMRGKGTRGETEGYMCRVNIKDLEKLAAEERANRPQAASSRGGAASSQKEDFVAITGMLIDLSSGPAVHKTFGKWSREWEVQAHAGDLNICYNHKEVLVPFRGVIPEAIFELIGEDTGLSKGPLGKAASVARETIFMRCPRACEFPLPNKRAHFSTAHHLTVL